MDLAWKILGCPFTWGLVAGLVFAVWALAAGRSAKKTLRKEVRRLEGEVQRLETHCRTANELNAKSQQGLMDENAQLKASNENLRISLAALKDKPDRAELQQLYKLDKAVHLMYARAPGFAPAWESAMQEAQAELDKTASGVLPWIRRIVSFGGGHGGTPPALPDAAPKGDA